MEEALGRMRGRRTVLLGIGNILKGDDGLGPELAARVARSGIMPSIDAGTTPENQAGAVARLDPEVVLVVDAVHMDLPAGSVRLLEAGGISGHPLGGTHSLSPSMVMERMAGETGAEVLLLAVQPRSLGFGEPLSDEVVAALDRVMLALEELLRPGT